MSNVWAHSSLDNPFWQFSLDRYARDGISADCLDLQKQYGTDISILLYGFWLGQSGRAIPDESTAQRITEHIDRWRHEFVVPLRQSRINFKPLSNTLPARNDPIRAAVKNIELRAEQIEQAMLFEFTQNLDFENARDREQAMIRNVFFLLPGLVEAQNTIIDLARRVV